MVGQIGQLIDAPVCEVTLARIPEEFVGWEYRPGRHLEAGITNASRDVPGVLENKGPLGHRSEDDNAVRHVGIYALFDLCMGTDPQWI